MLYQNDDFGKEMLAGLKAGLGDKAGKMIVAEVSHEVTDPTVDQQIITLQASGADTLMHYSLSRYSAQAIRKAYDMGWSRSTSSRYRRDRSRRRSRSRAWTNP